MSNNAMIGVVVGALIVIVLGVVLFNNRTVEPASDLDSFGDELLPAEPLTGDDFTATQDPFAGDETLEGDTVSATPSTSPVATPATSAAAGAVKSFTVAGSNFKFDPAEIRVKQGDTVRITLTNAASFPHDWRVDEFKAATKVIQTGQQDTVEFVADKAGTFEYYCSVGNHRAMGMKGSLIVE